VDEVLLEALLDCSEVLTASTTLATPPEVGIVFVAVGTWLIITLTWLSLLELVFELDEEVFVVLDELFCDVFDDGVCWLVLAGTTVIVAELPLLLFVLVFGLIGIIIAAVFPLLLVLVLVSLL